MARATVDSEYAIVPDGTLLIEAVAEVPDSDESSTWDLLDNCGAYRGFASVPHRVSLTSAGPGGRIHVVASGALDIPFISRLRVDVDVTRRSC